MLAFDAARKRQRGFGFSRWAEAGYARQLRKVARHIGEIIGSFPDADLTVMPQMQAALARYSEALEPWARANAGRMLEEVSRRDERAWGEHAAGIGKALKAEIAAAPTGRAYRDLMELNVGLITSLPREAGERVHGLVTEALASGRRASEIADEIARSGEVSRSRAMTIARTETARASSIMTQVRAESIGVTSYIWRTSRDEAVRKSHKQMEGKVCRFDAPPLLSDGTRTHAGQIYNCRCFPEPIIPGDDYSP